ncbi:PREDICTED: prostaglandin E synthase 2 isoform X2 [Polistes dominula]|uniref:Prostaglandin E synthase 2 isoform X2 n=1 Tax=Polistes dominula TaxID=743375 RepID=A0ABM1J270_POLDO|nr:PREDICTED: prostaglandin E synthase 2 isoform X2 [Polistes dominula]
MLLDIIISQQPKSRNLLKIGIIGASIGIIAGTGYSFYKISEERKNLSLDGTTSANFIQILKHKPPITPSRKVIFPVNTTELKLTLFQYQTCPFCCKVRTFLDYYGISYDVVEVDPVLRKEISWSSYRKVPILLVQTKDGYQPLNDSSMIISLLSSYMRDQSQNVSELVEFYPNIGMHDDKGKFKYEIMNKYFLMYNQMPKNVTLNTIVEERKWRQWADDVLVHTLSPNVYRTLNESYETFEWFSEVGQWKEYFPTWERILIVNVGACAMWLIGKRLKKRHKLKEDVRQSLYDEVNKWLREIRANKTTFKGGENPDLSDLAVYGILKSIEGCTAFKDLLNNTKLSTWYNAMKERVDSYAGHELVNG